MEEHPGAAQGPALEADDATGRPRVPRGAVKERLREASARLLSSATLDDLTAFITVGRLAEEAGVSTGAIYSAYQPSEGVAGRGRSAPQAAARDMFTSYLGVIDGLSVEVLEAFGRFVEGRSADDEIVRTVADAVGDHVERAVRGAGWDYTQLWLCAAVGLNDSEVRDGVASTYRGVERGYADLLTVLLPLTGREPLDGLAVDEIARMLVDVADAGALRVRIEPERGLGVTSRLLMLMFAATTRRVDDQDDDFERRILHAVEAGGDHEQQVATAVRSIASSAGWHEVTLSRVRTAAGIEGSRLATIAPTRHHLATFVWSDVVDGVLRRASTRTRLDPRVQVVELVRDVADAACSRRSLVASLLQARLRDAPPDASASLDASSSALVSTLTELLVDRGADPADGAGHPTPAAAGASARARTAVDALLFGAASSDTDAATLATVLVDGLVEARTDRS